MTKRTINEAQEVLRGLALTAAQRQALEEEVHLRAEEAAEMMREFLANIGERVDGEVAALQSRLRSIRDRRRDLETGIEEGRVSMHDAGRTFDELLHEQETLEARASSLSSSLNELEDQEKNPLGAADDLFQRFPQIRPEFSF